MLPVQLASEARPEPFRSAPESLFPRIKILHRIHSRLHVHIAEEFVPRSQGPNADLQSNIKQRQ